MATSLTHRDYTVGWICALEVEQAAARASFDEEHPNLPSIPGDPNRYRFGCIAGHNVVVACLPDGEYGNNPAAAVAARMTINFPSMRFALMVGIGGGVPQPPGLDDIRLGDVVVSSAIGDVGGVVQYDRGRTVQDGDFKLTGSLNRPPEVLRQAVADLRATYRLKGGRITEYLAKIVSEHSTFASPATSLGLQDTLFKSDYEHPKRFDFSTCESCDASQVIKRPPRSPYPAIHYGIIASGNQVIKNGLKRDEISKKLGGVLCFEMEAAGLMNVFPCLIIRGICDYSDSHKNKQWQAYAAATAAAYSKEFLSQVAPSKVHEIQSVSVAMEKLRAPWLVPFERNLQFVGRDSQIKELEDKLFSKDSCSRIAIFGLGGIGKTQIALEYAYRLRGKSPGCAVFWIPAITAANFEQAYREIAELLLIPGVTDQKIDVKQLIKITLSKEDFGEWLLIIDNADDADILMEPGIGSSPSRLIDYLPSSPKGSIIFTTRTRKAAMEYGRRNALEVLDLDLDASKKILEKYLFRKQLLSEEEDITQLLELLAYLPLAIVQAAAYMNKKDMIEILSEDFEDGGRYKGLQNPIATTWLISYEQIRRQDPLAVEYLSFMACLMRESIPKTILPPGASKKKEIDALGTLTAYSFLNKQETRNVDRIHSSTGNGVLDQLFNMHRLVYLTTRNWLRSCNQLTTWVDIALKRLVDIVPNNGYGDLIRWKTYLPHANYTAASLDISDIESKIMLLFKIGRCQDIIGQYKAAEWAHLQALELKLETSGEEDLLTVTIRIEIGAMLRRQGKHVKAEQTHQQTLKLSEKTLGVEHPHMLRCMNDLALVLQDLGKYQEAEQMDRQTLELRKKVLGVEHPDTLISMSNLASVLGKQGKYHESIALYERVCAGFREVLGASHPSTLLSTRDYIFMLECTKKQSNQ